LWKGIENDCKGNQEMLYQTSSKAPDVPESPPQREARSGRIQDIQIYKSRRENRDYKENRTVAVRHETLHFTGWYIDASVRTLQNRWLIYCCE